MGTKLQVLAYGVFSTMGQIVKVLQSFQNIPNIVLHITKKNSTTIVTRPSIFVQKKSIRRRKYDRACFLKKNPPLCILRKTEKKVGKKKLK